MKDGEQVHPFAIVPIEVMLDNRLTLETMRVLVTLFSFRNKLTGLAFPSRDAISERCGMHPSNISAATTKLVELGWLVKTGVGGYSKSTRYDIHIPEKVAEQATIYKAKCDARKGIKVAQSATVAEQATLAQSATPESSPSGYTPNSPIGYTQRTDQLTDKESTHTEKTVCASNPTSSGLCCKAMMTQGIQACNPHHPVLLTLIDAGATEQEFSEAAKTAVSMGNRNFGYVIGIVRKQREDAAKLLLHRGRMPTKQESVELENKEATQRAKARLFGVKTEKDITNEATRL